MRSFHRSTRGLIGSLTVVVVLLFLLAAPAGGQNQPAPADQAQDSLREGAENTFEKAQRQVEEETTEGGKDPEPEAPLDRSSPRALVESLLELGDRAESGAPALWSEAARTLDVPEGLQGQAAQRARALHQVLSKLEPDLAALPNAETAQQMQLSEYRLFPRPEVHQWVFEQLPAEMDPRTLKSVVLFRGPDDQWLFTAVSVQNVMKLAQSLAEVRPRSDPVVQAQEMMTLVGPTLENTGYWAWGALLIAIAGGLLLGRVLKSLLWRVAARFEQRDCRARAIMTRSLANPLSLALLTTGLVVGLFGFVHPEGDARGLALRMITLLIVTAVGWFIYNLVELIELSMRRATRRSQPKINETVIPIVRKALRVLVVVIFVLVIAEAVFEMDLTALIAGLGVAGLAISLAAQESIKNIFGSLTVFFDKPFVLGDFITFDGDTGVVEDIGFRSTRLRLLSGHLVTIPNMKFIDGTIENIGMRPYIRREMDVTITYDTPVEKIEQAAQIVREVLMEDEEVVQGGQFDLVNFPPRISFDNFNSDSLNIKAYYWYQFNCNPERTYWTFLEHCQLVNMKLFRRFEQAGIELAFPTQTLYLAGDEKRQLSVRVLQDSAG